MVASASSRRQSISPTAGRSSCGSGMRPAIGNPRGRSVIVKRFLISGIGAFLLAAGVGSVDVAAQGGGGGGGMNAAAIKEAESKPTPKRANGVTDLSGLWVPTVPRGKNVPAALDRSTGSFDNVLRGRTGTAVDFERDAGVRQRVFPRESRPWYKPQHWERVQFNDVNGHNILAPDPDFQCMPPGVPRIGLPQEIVQTDKHLIFQTR